MPTHHYGSEREALGARLRELRLREGISGVALAGRLGWVQSKVSRLERGRQTASDSDIRAWTSTLGADDIITESLLEQLRGARTEYVTWRRGLDEGQASVQQDLVGLGAHATLVRNFEVGVMPGLLQTAEYARYRLIENVEVSHAPKGDLDTAIMNRMQRQQILYDSSKQLRFIISESVLRTTLCPIDVMHGQLDRLLALIGMPNVEIGVIAFGTHMPVAPLHGFAMFDDLIIIETFGGEVVVRDADDSQYYGHVFEKLRSVALHDDDARRLIGQATEDLRQDP